MSMGGCSPWRSAPRWGPMWNQPARCMWNGSTVPCVIRRVPSPARRMPSPNAMQAFDALVGLQLFDHNFHRTHRALQLPLAEDRRRYHHRSPAMALDLTDHRWSFLELLTTRIP